MHAIIVGHTGVRSQANANILQDRGASFPSNDFVLANLALSSLQKSCAILSCFPKVARGINTACDDGRSPWAGMTQNGLGTAAHPALGGGQSEEAPRPVLDIHLTPPSSGRWFGGGGQCPCLEPALLTASCARSGKAILLYDTLVRHSGYSQGLTGSCHRKTLSALLYARAEEPSHNTPPHQISLVLAEQPLPSGRACRGTGRRAIRMGPGGLSSSLQSDPTFSTPNKRYRLPRLA